MLKDSLISLIEEDNSLQESLDTIGEVSDDMETLDLLFYDESAEEKLDRLFPTGLNESYQKRLEREYGKTR